MKLDLSKFKLDRVIELLYASNRFDRLFILCNHETLHKVRALTRDLTNVEFEIITSNDLEDDEVIIAW